MNRAQLINRIQELKSSLEKAEIELKSYTPTIEESVVGDILADGTCVLIKNEQLHFAVVVSANEFCSSWDDIDNKFKTFRDNNGYDKSWFIPSIKQLRLAYELIPNFFDTTAYWSSTEDSSITACSMYFHNGFHGALSKQNSLCVRAFRLIVF